MTEALYRADRALPPRSALPVRPIAANAGWCDAAGDKNYNRPVCLPYPASHEAMRRFDGLYDIVVVLSHNRKPRIQGSGSAVFFHLSGNTVAPTAGCVAIARAGMQKILACCGRGTRLVIWSSGGFQKSPSRSAHGWRHS
jgi:L,D-peptidoglycan transpeptidase YkuD (ErfK/YbiS/YcfS/YnhG family)